MRSQVIVGESVRRSEVKRQMLVAAAGAALALSVAAGLGLWRVAERNYAIVTTAPAPHQATSDARIASSEAPTFFIVSSRAQAEALQTAVAEENQVRTYLQVTPREVQVLLAGDDETARQFVRVIEENHTRTAFGLPLLQVVDLRTP
jgi:hypothetical protein